MSHAACDGARHAVAGCAAHAPSTPCGAGPDVLLGGLHHRVERRGELILRGGGDVDAAQAGVEEIVQALAVGTFKPFEELVPCRCWSACTDAAWSQRACNARSQEWRTRRMTLQRRRKVCPFGGIRILINVNVQRMVRSPTERRALPALQRATREHLRLRQ